MINPATSINGEPFAPSFQQSSYQRMFETNVNMIMSLPTLPTIAQQYAMSLNYYCLDCQGDHLEFKTICDLEAHIASDHLNICPYECEKCRYAKFPTEFALVSHYKSVHGQTEFFVRYRFTSDLVKKREELAEKLQNCVNFREFTLKTPKTPNGFTLQTNRVVPIDVKIEPTLIVDDVDRNIQCSSKEVISPISLPTAVSTQHLSLPHCSTSEPSMSFIPQLSDISFTSEVQAEEKKERVCHICQLCGVPVARQRSSLIYHANTKHAKLDMYECSLCQKTWQTIAKSDVIKHIKSRHESADGTVDLSLIVDNRKKLAVKLREITAQCFPERDSSKRLRPLTQGTSPPHSSTYDQNSEQFKMMSQIRLDMPFAVNTLSDQVLHTMIQSQFNNINNTVVAVSEEAKDDDLDDDGFDVQDLGEGNPEEQQ